MKYKGVLYPLTKHPQGYFHNAATDVEQIKCNIATLIMTEPTERVMEPAFGISLRSVNTNGPIEIIKGKFRELVASMIKRWEKRIQVTDIVINFELMEEELVLMISIYFINPVNINSVIDLHIQKSLGAVPLPF